MKTVFDDYLPKAQVLKTSSTDIKKQKNNIIRRKLTL